MAEHVWSVVCEKLLTEENGVISLVSVLERINLHGDLGRLESDLAGAEGFAYPMRLMVWCVRSDYSRPETFSLRISWSTPNGNRVPTKVENRQINLDNVTGARLHVLVPGVPWNGPGLYWLVVEIQNEGEEWTTAARLPIEVVVLPQPQQESDKASA